MILDKIENWKTYAGLSAGIAAGLELLASGKLDGLAVGKHELQGKKLYASVQEYEPKQPGEGRWEAHQKYIDIQYLASGYETMGCCPAGDLRVAIPYDTDKDVLFFEGEPAMGAVLRVEPKMFAIFFPQDAHMPMLSAGVPGQVKKIVLKVAVG